MPPIEKISSSLALIAIILLLMACLIKLHTINQNVLNVACKPAPTSAFGGIANPQLDLGKKQ